VLAVKLAHSLLVFCLPSPHRGFGFWRLLALLARRIVTHLAPIHRGARAFILSSSGIEFVLALFLPARGEGFDEKVFFLRKCPLLVSNDAGHLLHDLWLEVLEYNGEEREIDMQAMVEAELEERG
jgi:hypothetical protein